MDHPLYLGSDSTSGQQLAIEASDLVTHAVCVGMTGSGKTGSASCCSRNSGGRTSRWWRSIRRAT